MAETKIRVFLVDDHPLVRESLTSLINQQDDMEVCGDAEDMGHGLKLIGSLTPDVAIVDISLKESSGLELVKALRLRFPATQLVVLSMHDEKLYAERCLRAGARAYVMKRESTRRIITAIRAVAEGKLFLSDAMATELAQKFVGGKQSGGSPLEDLSDRELEVFNLLGRGMGTRQVAESLNVSIKTVQAYCARIKQKMQLGSATELLREAVRWHEQQSGL